MREVIKPLRKVKCDEEEIRREIRKLGISFKDEIPLGKVAGLYEDYISIRRLVPEETWRNYTLLGIRDLQEQKLLRKALRVLRAHAKQIRKAYNAKKKAERKAAREASKGVHNKRKGKSTTTSDS